MSSVTIRFVHRETHTPVLEEEVAAFTTLGAMRVLLVGRLASEEACMMRVFTKWHAEIVLPSGKKRLIELTAEDEDEPLHSLGISHLSEVQLEGPLTFDSMGVGQAVGVLGAQLQQMRADISSTKELMKQSHTMLAAILEGQQTAHIAQRSFNRLLLLPNEADGHRRDVEAEECLAFARLRLLYEAEAGYRTFNFRMEKLSQLCTMYAPRPHCFTIDRTTPHKSFTISQDGTTSTQISNAFATFRASKPLSLTNNRWAVRMVKKCSFCVGLLPTLSADQVAHMEGSSIDELGGWSAWFGGAVYGKWQCAKGKVTYKEGDLVTFDFSFAAKTLAISCDGKTVVAHIPSIKDGDALYPAVSMFDKAVSAGFENYP